MKVGGILQDGLGAIVMAAYVISEVETVDPERFEKYRSLAPATIAQYGGRYLARGGVVETVEGGDDDWQRKQMVIVEFPTLAKAHEWYASPEYAAALEVRRGALNRRLVFVEGISAA